MRRRIRQLWARARNRRRPKRRSASGGPRQQLQLQPGPVRRQLASGPAERVASGHVGLTEAERSVVGLLASGLAPKQIAFARGTSLSAVRKHLREAKRKTGARTLVELAATAHSIRENKDDIRERLSDDATQFSEGPDGPDDLIDRLTARQLQVVALLRDGLRYSEIAERLAISERQVGRHVARARARMGVQSAAQLIALFSATQARSDEQSFDAR